MKKTPKPKVKRSLAAILSKKEIRLIIQRAKRRGIQQCPFCGSEVVHSGPHAMSEFSVSCFGCSARIVVIVDEAPQRLKTLEQAESWCVEESIRRWNKRTLHEKTA